MKVRQEISNILVEENTLMEIVKLMGTDVLPDGSKASYRNRKSRKSRLFTAKRLS